MRLDRLAPLFMVLAFLSNLLVCFLDPTEFKGTRALGKVVFLLGGLLLLYVTYYLRSGFLGEVEPNLDHLVTRGPYRWCRHPLYLSFMLIMLGLDLMFGSPVGIVVTLVLALPSIIYRARLEEKALADRFGQEWEAYKERTRF
ncbi:MAG: isoprenylcysteine carboxylmethyltransferase family protein [Anaerolineae bacterium]